MWICIDVIFSPGIWSVATCDDSIVLLSGSLEVILFEIMTGAIVGVDSFSRLIFAPESAITSL